MAALRKTTRIAYILELVKHSAEIAVRQHRTNQTLGTKMRRSANAPQRSFVVEQLLATFGTKPPLLYNSN